jgi:hypothetical protein
MWYALQTGLAIYVAYFWCTEVPGNSPDNFGHGLFLGGIVAWFCTLILTGLLDICKRIGRAARSLTSRTSTLSLRRHKQPEKHLTIRGG